MTKKDAQQTIYVCVNMKDTANTLRRIVKSNTYIGYIDATLQEEADFRHIQQLWDQGMDIHLVFVLPDGNDIPEKQIDGLKRACSLCREISFYDCTNGVNLVTSYRLTNKE